MLLFKENQLLSRRRQVRSKGIYLALFLFLAFFLILSPSSSAGKKLIHIVKKGDTLWSICQQYYGNPYLWPELWEMNKFVTNPHWLRPGDVIRLLEYEEKPTPEKKYEEKALEPAKRVVTLKKEPLRIQMGIDVSSLTNTKALGFLQTEMIEPWGSIYDFKAEKMLIGENDTVYVKMYKEGIKPGDIFTIYSVSDPVKHPLTGKKFGYIHSFNGILKIEKVEKDYYVARISESFRTIYKDHLLIPYYPVPSCILPVPCQDMLTAHIVAAKDNLDLLGQYSVVYIDAGHNAGVRKGNLLEVIEEKESISDKQKKEKVALPPTILGKILILHTTLDTSIGVVFWASKDFTNGATIRPLIWEERPRRLATLPECEIEQGE
jgi:hypothetical protein